MKFNVGDTVTDTTDKNNLWVRDKDGEWQFNKGGFLTDTGVQSYLDNGSLLWVKRGGYQISDKAVISDTQGGGVYTRFENDIWRRSENDFGFLTDLDIIDFVKNGTVERVFTL